MFKLLLSSIALLLFIYPLAKARKNLITENELFGFFLGNYIYFVHYLVIISLILCLVHYLVFPIQKKLVYIIIPLFLLIVASIGYYNYRNPEVTYTKIALNKEADVKSMKIAFVADFHLIDTANKNLFIDMVSLINKQEPDIIIMGGDILQNSHTKVVDDYKEIFSKLKAKHGIYTILGNHEYYGYDIEENLIYLKSLGIHILRDEVLKIDGINFIARDDIKKKEYVMQDRAELKEILEENHVDMTEPVIILDHNPQSISESIENKADVQLSGHTHAGQFFPYNLLLKYRLENAYAYKKIGNLHTYVTSGVGVGFWKIVGPWQMPYRLGTRSEISIIEIDFQ